jgi:uncharacterized protein
LLIGTILTAGYRVGRESVYDYLDYTQSIFLFKVLRQYTGSLRSGDLADKKIYVIDNGLYNANCFKVSPNNSSLLESAVYYELLIQNPADEVFFYRENGKFECDFVIAQGGEVRQAIQVSVEMIEESTRIREIKGLVQTCQKFGLKTGTILTLDQEEHLVESNISIQVVPVWKWILTD